MSVVFLYQFVSVCINLYQIVTNRLLALIFHTPKGIHRQGIYGCGRNYLTAIHLISENYP